MKDFLGIEIQVGQEVVVCQREGKYTANLMKSRVVGFTERMVRIEHKNWRGATTKLCEPRKLVAFQKPAQFASYGITESGDEMGILLWAEEPTREQALEAYRGDWPEEFGKEEDGEEWTTLNPQITSVGSVR